jgi:hypothetical protein
MRVFLLSLIVGIVPGVAGALTPVEGILLGEAVTEIQNDPLSLVFTDIYGTQTDTDYRKVKNYEALVWSGRSYAEQCSILGPSTYSTTWREKQAKRSIVSTLQYIGLDTTIKAIGAYAKNLQIAETEYGNLVTNLIGQYCSQNVTVMSLKTIKKSLEYYYQNPDANILPNVENSRFVTEAFRNGSLSSDTRSHEFNYAIRNFRAFCSWGGSSEDYRLLAPYLKNPFIMSYVTRNLAGFRFSWDEPAKKMIWKNDSPEAVRVSCKDLICRQAGKEQFLKDFPTSTGSTGIQTDVNKLFCQEFRYLDYDAKSTIPEVKAWIKAMEIEEPYLETAYFVSLMTGVPEPFMIQNKFSDIPAIVKSSVDERWTKWSKDSLTVYSRDLLFEESLRVKAEPRRPLADVRDGFMIDFHVTLGEMDRIMRNNDKISMSFNFKFSKSWLRSLITRWNEIARNVDVEKEQQLKKDMAHYIELQLRSKEKLFTQKVWNEDFPRLIAEEMLGQVLSYRGSFFEGYSDEMITVPVRFRYGVFALSYLRYRSQVAKGSAELNL